MKSIADLNQRDYLPQVDGLRAIAVAAVLLFHAFPNILPGGFTGVDIFFVISGFLISGILFTEFESQRFTFKGFYMRRVKRIFPALILVVSATLFFGWFVLYGKEFEQLGSHAFGGATFLANVQFIFEAGYFDNLSSLKPLLHLWSLAVEEQFYLFFPIILWITYRLSKNGKTLLIVLSVLFIASFIASVVSSYYNPTFGFYSILTRAWELLVGSFLALIYRRFRGKTSKNGHQNLYGKPSFRDGFVFISGLLLILISLFSISEELEFPGFWALVPTIGTALTIVGSFNSSLSRVVLENEFMIWIGKLSYPLYLWHWPLLSFGYILSGGTPSILDTLTLLAMSLLFAWLTYRYIEVPLRGIRLPKHNIRVFQLLLTAMTLVALASLTIKVSNGFEGRAANKEMRTISSQFSVPNYIDSNCDDRFHFTESEKYAYWFCRADETTPPTFLLLGNSFANHLFSGFSTQEQMVNQSFLSIGACEPAWAEDKSIQVDEGPYPCLGTNKLWNQMEFINRIVAANGSLKFAILDGIDLDTSTKYLDRLLKRIDFLESQNLKVIIFEPHLKLPYDIRSCFGRGLIAAPNTCVLDSEEHEKIHREFQKMTQYIQAKSPETLWFDQNEAICGSVSCQFTFEGVPILRDEHSHYSEFGSKLVATSFANWALNNLPDLYR